MTFSRLIELARHGAAMETYATFEEYEDIRDFAKTCRYLAYEELDNLELRKRVDLIDGQSTDVKALQDKVITQLIKIANADCVEVVRHTHRCIQSVLSK